MNKLIAVSVVVLLAGCASMNPDPYFPHIPACHDEYVADTCEEELVARQCNYARLGDSIVNDGCPK